MLRLLLADLRRHAGTWAWTCVITLVAGACVSGQLRILHGALDSAAKATGVTPRGVPRSTDMLHAARLMSGFIIALVVLAAAAVLVSTAGLALTQRRRDHGLWRALGMRPGGLRALLLGQLVVVAALGSLIGGLAGGPVSALMMPLLIEQDVAMPGTVARWEPADLAWTALVVAGSVLLGGWGPARRAARATETDLLRGTEERGRSRPARVLGVLGRLVVALGLAAGVIAAAVNIHRGGAGSERASEAAPLGALGALVLVCVLTAWLVPVVLRALAHLPVPGPAWLVATRTAMLESRRSTATVLPFLVAFGLVAVALGGARMGVGRINTDSFLAVFGPALATAWIGGVAVIAMSAGRRRRDAALLAAAGAPTMQVRAAQVLEGVLHAVVACLLGIVVCALSTALYAPTSGTAWADVPGRLPWAEFGVTGALTLATTCAAVVVSAWAGRGASVATVLRARD